PAGARPKYSVSPSQENDGRLSLRSAVLIASPRVTGADHGSSTLSREAPQMSCRPFPPGRLDENTTSRPSLRTFGWMSFAALLSSATGAAGPKLPSAFSRLTKMSGPLEKYSDGSPASKYDGPCSSRALLGPSGPQPR